MSRPKVAGSVQWDELRNVVQNYPVWPGDTISHATMGELEALGFARRQGDGNWIPTAAGVRRFEAGPIVGDRGVY